MKSLVRYFVASWFALTAAVVKAAADQTDKVAPQASVSIAWVVLFIAVFIGICVWIGVAAVRAERKSKAASEKQA